LHHGGRLDEAELAYRAILQSHHNNFGAAYQLGLLSLQRGRVAESEGFFLLATQCNPESASSHHNRALVLRALSRHEEALASCKRAVELEPGNAAILFDHGRMLVDLLRDEEAIQSFDNSIAIDPSPARIHFARGNALLRLKRPGEALLSFDKAIAQRPGFPEAHNNRANALRELNRLEDALPGYRIAAQLRQNDPVTLHNFALALHDSGQFEQALKTYNRAVGLAPNFSEARKARATLRLLLGEFEKGFAEFEARLLLPEAAPPLALRPIRYWSGENLEGKSIAIYGDAAFGDLLQFSRFIPQLIERRARVILLVPRQFNKVVEAMQLGVSIRSDLDGTADYRCELMSLPFLFQARAETIPPQSRIAPDQPRIAKWKARLSPDRLNVGICWQGNPERNIDKGRSIALAEFEPLARIPGVRLFSLQKKHGLEQLEVLPDEMVVETFGPDFDEGPDSFVDTAAVMASLDLIVTSDTSVAHLAAAIGRPTWIALRYAPEWRWLLGRQDSPWYPTVRLFRQQQPGRWGAVFDDLARALSKETAEVRTCGKERDTI